MKKEILINVAAFAAGAVVGLGTSYIFFRKKYEKIAEEEIEEARKYYTELIKYKKIKKPDPDLMEKAVDGKIDADDIHIGFRNPIDHSSYVNYSAYYAIKNKSEEETETVDPAENEYPREEEVADSFGQTITEQSKRIDDLIFEIDPDSYESDYENFDKEVLFYYRYDGVLATENEELIDNPKAVVGDFDLDESMNTVYIRNGKLGTDYEIEKVDGSFRDSVGG